MSKLFGFVVPCRTSGGYPSNPYMDGENVFFEGSKPGAKALLRFLLEKYYNEGGMSEDFADGFTEEWKDAVAEWNEETPFELEVIAADWLYCRILLISKG